MSLLLPAPGLYGQIPIEFQPLQQEGVAHILEWTWNLLLKTGKAIKAMMLHVRPLKQACHTAPKNAPGVKEIQAGRWISRKFQLMTEEYVPINRSSLFTPDTTYLSDLMIFREKNTLMIKLILLPDNRNLKMHKITSKFLTVNNFSLSVWKTSLPRSQALLQNHLIHFSKSKWHLAVSYLQRWKLNFFLNFILKVVLFTYEIEIIFFQTGLLQHKRRERRSLLQCFCSNTSRTASCAHRIWHPRGRRSPALTAEYFKTQRREFEV